MAWRFRKSKRLPFGFRLNFSKSGIGYSWGVRGFRVGKDSKGRVVRTLSIPGTGIYRREFVTQKSGQYQQPQSGSSSGRVGLIVAIGAVSFLIGALTHSILVFVVLLAVGVVLLNLGSSKRGVMQSAAAPTNAGQPTTFQSLGFQTVRLQHELMLSLKNEMLKSRMASQYDLYFESDLSTVLFHFATLDGAARPAAGLLFLEVLGAIHPKQWQGFTGESAAEVMSNIVFKPASDYQTLKEPSLMRFARSADESNGSQLATRLAGFHYEIAKRVASVDGPLSVRGQDELARFRALLDSPSARPSLSNEIRNAELDSFISQPIAIPHSIPEHTSSSSSAPIETSNDESNDSIEKLVSEVRTFLADIEPPLRFELRKVRAAGDTREFLENDIRGLILRVGISGSDVSAEAVELHLSLFRSLHPKTFAFGREATKDLMRKIANANPAQYSGAYPKPFILKLIESFDAVNGTRYAAKVREMYYRVACFAANTNGQVLPEKEPTLAAVRSGLGR